MAAGAVTFGLDVETTERFSKAIGLFGKMRREVDKTANSQVKGAQSAAKALLRNEKALQSAIIKAGQYRQELVRLGAPKQQIANVTRAITTLAKGLDRAGVNAIKAGRSMDSFNTTLGRSRKKIVGMGGNLDKTSGKGAKFNRMMRNMESASVLAVGPLSGIGARIRSLGAIAGRGTIKLVAFFAAIAAGVVVIFKLTKAALAANLAVERITAGLTAGSGSAAIAKIQFKSLAEFASKMGLNLAAAGQEFGKLSAAARGTSLEGEGVDKIFRAVSKASVALRLTQEQTTGAFRALQQMISKGTVQAEELRGQLAERLPGAFALAAKAMGLTTKALGEQLKKGQILAVDLLPKLAKALEEAYGQQAEDAVGSLQAAINRLSTETLLFNKALDDTVGISSSATSLLNSLASAIAFLRVNMVNLISTILALSIATAAFFLRLKLLVVIFAAIGAATGKLIVAIRTLSFAMFAIPGVGTLAMLGRIAFAVVAGTAAWFGLSAAIDDTAEKHTNLIDAADALTESLESGIRASNAVVKNVMGGLRGELLSLGIALRETQAEILELARTDVPGGMGVPIAPGAGKELEDAQVRLREQIAKTQERINALKAALFELNQPASLAVDELTTAGKRAEEKINDLNDKLEKARLHIMDLSGLNPLGPDFIGNLITAKDLLDNLSTQDLGLLLGQLKTLGFAGDTAAEALAKLIAKQLDAKRTAAALTKQWADTPAILKKIEIQISSLGREIVAMGRGVGAVEELNKALAKEELVEKYRKELQKMTGAARQSVLTLMEFTALLEQHEAAAKKFEETQEIFDTVRAAALTMKDGFKDAFTGAKSAMEAFKDTMLTIADQIIDKFLEMGIINPILNSIFGTSLGTIDFSSLFTRVAGVTRGTSDIGGLVGGAGGGHFGVGQLVLTGEEGPELIKTRRSGTIIPNDEIGSGGTIKSGSFREGDTIIVNINGVQDFDSFRRSRSQTQAAIMAAWQRAGDRDS